MKRRRVIVASVMIVLIAVSIARPIVHELSLTPAQRDMINPAKIRSDWEGNSLRGRRYFRWGRKMKRWSVIFYVLDQTTLMFVYVLAYFFHNGQCEHFLSKNFLESRVLSWLCRGYFWQRLGDELSVIIRWSSRQRGTGDAEGAISSSACSHSWPWQRRSLDGR